MLPLTRIRRPLVLAVAALLALAQGAALAQYPPAPDQPPPAQAQGVYSQAQLDQMLAPIALYPDALLSQILMAATYPLEVVQAARWSRANPGLRGDDAVRAVEDQDWDPSVKSLVDFPVVLERMDQNLQWTQALGDAFLAQEPQVMEEVQALRGRAQAAGQLYSDSHLRVADDGGVIAIEPVNPQVIYVPYYDPLVVYGGWWWPAYPPVVWAPWPGYVMVQRPGVHVAFFWGTGIRVAVNFFFGAPDWHHRRVNVVNVNTFYYRPRIVHPETRVYTRVVPGPWEHDPFHRRGLRYRSVQVQREYAPQRQTIRRPGAQPQLQREQERQRERSRPTTTPPSPARQQQLQQQRQYEQRQTPPVSPARQQQLQQQQQYEQRRQGAQQPSPASRAQRQQQELQQYQQQYQQQRQRGGDPKPRAGAASKDSGSRGTSPNRPRGRGPDSDERGPSGQGSGSNARP